MKKFLLTLLSLVIVFMQSCTSQDDCNISTQTTNEIIGNDDLYIERESSSISTSDASKIATLFKGVATTRSASAYEVITISDSISIHPLVYVINYGQDNGFVVISASKNTQPILAFSDNGKFVFNEDNPSAEFLNGFKNLVKNAQLCTSDSLRIKYALQWASFEKIPEQASTRALPSEIEQKKAAERTYQESQGYKYIGDLSTAQYFLSTNDYEAFMKEMEDCSDPQYDYREVVQVFAKTITQESIGELLQTKWHQYKPFNIGTPNGFAGCGPIAIAQIVYYHKYPQKYDWNNIAIYPVQNVALSNLMNDIWDASVISYEEDGTYSNIQKAKTTFEEFGYNVYFVDNVTNDKLSSQIKLKNPVFISGFNTENGHAWVCDGYKNVRDVVIATLIKKPNDPRFKRVNMSPNGFMIYEATALKKKTSEAGEYFHMNFGWGGGSNGWYCDYKYKMPKNLIRNQEMLIVNKK